MTIQSIDDLFAQTLTGDDDDQSCWEAIHSLRKIGSREIFERAAEWCRSELPLVREQGCDVLAQLGKTADHPAHNFPEEAYTLVAPMAEAENDPRVLVSAVSALGHLDNPDAVPLIARHYQHPDEDVRSSVAFALGSFPNDARSCNILLLLMKDPAVDVRDWATFGLGVLGDCDTDEIRDALFALLCDTDEDVREEALVGLSKRKDLRALPALIAALQQQEIGRRITDAANLILGLDESARGWDAAEYLDALRKRFPSTGADPQQL